MFHTSCEPCRSSEMNRAKLNKGCQHFISLFLSHESNFLTNLQDLSQKSKALFLSDHFNLVLRMLVGYLTHTCTLRTCKVYAERTQPGIWTQELLAGRIFFMWWLFFFYCSFNVLFVLVLVWLHLFLGHKLISPRYSLLLAIVTK